MTMRQLAKIANVSVSTVSKAFSKSGEISEETRNYIFEIAKKEGCYDKYCKSDFGKKVIAVVCPEFQSRYYSQYLTYLKKEIEKRSGVMIVGCNDFDANSKQDLISYFTQSAKVDGILVVGTNALDMNYNTPIVVIGHSEDFDSISLSMEHSIKDAVEYLLENGHVDIAFIGEKHTSSKLDIFSKTVAQTGIELNDEYVIESKERFEEAGYHAMNQLFELKNPPTAVVAAYDSIAIGAMKSIYEHGLSIPKDISLIGMDDNRENAYLNAALTSITSYTEDLCEIAVELLFDRIEKGNKSEKKKIKVSTELVKRNSVGKVKTGF